MKTKPYDVAKTGTWAVLAATFLVSVVAATLALPMSADAQEDAIGKDGAAKAQYKPTSDSRRPLVSQGRETQGDVKAAQTGPLTSASVRIVDDNSDPDPIVNRIVATISGCDVGENATVTIEDDDGTRATFTNGSDVTIIGYENRVVVQGTAESGNIGDADFSGGDDPNFNPGDGTLVSSTGITCDRDDDGSEEDADDGDADGRDDNDDNRLLDLDCDDLLQRSRSINGNGGQYGDGFADADVQARIVVCLEQEVINNTAADEELPDTGGLPLLGLAVLGLASTVAGASVIRGARRGE